MQIIYSPRAKAELDFWVKSGNKAILNKILLLVKSINEEPYHGIGKPEPLKHNLSGCWSRRIDNTNLTYKIVQTIL